MTPKSHKTSENRKSPKQIAAAVASALLAATAAAYTATPSRAEPRMAVAKPALPPQAEKQVYFE